MSYTLLTVNTAPERAFRLVGQVAEALKGSYTITHVDNCASIEEVESAVRRLQPDVVFSASMWNSEQAEQISSIARAANPKARTLAIPQGLQVQKGPEFTVQWLVRTVPGLLDAEQGTALFPDFPSE